jgi:hypothetical protein
MIEFHGPRCDCDRCLPGMPAPATNVRQDSRRLFEEEPSDYVRERRQEQRRAAHARWLAANPDKARAALEAWRASELVRETQAAKKRAQRARARRRRELDQLLESFNEERAKQ